MGGYLVRCELNLHTPCGAVSKNFLKGGLDRQKEQDSGLSDQVLRLRTPPEKECWYPNKVQGLRSMKTCGPGGGGPGRPWSVCRTELRRKQGWDRDKPNGGGAENLHGDTLNRAGGSNEGPTLRDAPGRGGEGTGLYSTRWCVTGHRPPWKEVRPCPADPPQLRSPCGGGRGQRGCVSAPAPVGARRPRRQGCAVR